LVLRSLLVLTEKMFLKLFVPCILIFATCMCNCVENFKDCWKSALTNEFCIKVRYYCIYVYVSVFDKRKSFLYKSIFINNF
jgi:hypothetical protein